MTEPSSAPAPIQESERDLAELQVKSTVKAAAAFGGMSGVVAVLTGLQFTTSASFVESIYDALPWSLAGFGAVQLGLALLVLRNHFPACVAASLVGVLVALLAVAWVLLSVTHQLYSALALLEVPLAGCAALLAPLALGPTKRAWDAKKRLQDAGIELGF